MANPSVITNLSQLTSRWLEDRLPMNGSLLAERAITAINIEPHPAHSSTALVKLALEASAPRRLIFKISNRFAGTARAEALFHQEIAPAMPSPPVPPCHYVAFDPGTATANLILEDVSSTHIIPTEVSEFTLPQLEDMVDTLASIHAFWWDNPRISQPDFLEHTKADWMSFRNC